MHTLIRNLFGLALLLGISTILSLAVVDGWRTQAKAQQPAQLYPGRFATTTGHTEKGIAFVLLTDTATGRTWVMRLRTDAMTDYKVNEWIDFSQAILK